MGKRNKPTPPQSEQPATGAEAYPRSYALFILVPMAILACGFIYAILPNRAEKPATTAATLPFREGQRTGDCEQRAFAG